MLRALRGRDELLVALSQLVAQGTLLAITPVLSRHFPPGAIGLYQVVLSASLVLTPIATLRAELPIPGPVSDHTARGLTRRAAIAAASLQSALVGAALLYLLLGSDESTTLGSIAVIVATSALLAVDNAWLLRAGELRRLAVRNLLTGLAAAAFQLISIAWSDSFVGLVLALAGGRLLAIALTWRGSRATATADSWHAGSSDLDLGGRESVTSVGSAMVAAGTAQLPILVLAPFVEAPTLGQIAVAYRLSTAPMSLLGTGLAQAVAGTLGRLLREDPGQAVPTYRRWLLGLRVTSLVLATAIAVVSLVFHEQLLGEGWERAGRFAAILAVGGIGQLAVVPFLGLYGMVGRSSELLRMQLARAGVLVTSFVVPLALGAPLELTLLMFSGFALCVYLAMSVRVERLLAATSAHRMGRVEASQ